MYTPEGYRVICPGCGTGFEYDDHENVFTSRIRILIANFVPPFVPPMVTTLPMKRPGSVGVPLIVQPPRDPTPGAIGSVTGPNVHWGVPASFAQSRAKLGEKGTPTVPVTRHGVGGW